MSDPSTGSEGEQPRSRVLRWLLGGGFLCGVVFVGLMNFPIYRFHHERDETGGAIDFLKKISSYQADYLQRNGRYLGSVEWAEWPRGPFPSKDGIKWGSPTDAVWAHLPFRPKEPLLFKFRLRASEHPGLAPKKIFPNPPPGPWFIVQARADLNGDQKVWLIEMTSATEAIYSKNAGE